MRHSGLTVFSWVLFIVTISLGVLAGYFLTSEKTETVAACFALIMSLMAVSISYSQVLSCGRGGVDTTFLGRNDHDLVYGATYKVISCAGWVSKTNDVRIGYVVVLEDAGGNLWSCVLPKEPPAHFVYTRGDERFTSCVQEAATSPRSDEATAAT